jgi:HEAT repeat protein
MIRALPAAALAAICAIAVPAAAQTPAEWQDVIRNLRHPNPQTRLDAVKRLGEAGYVPAAEAVSALIADPDDRVQLAAIDAELTFFLADRVGGRWSIGGGGGKSRAQQAFEAGPLVRTAAPAPPALIDHLIAAMRDENARVQFDAVHALGFIAESPLPAAQVTRLAAELDHYDPVMRAATARVLGRLRAREAGDQLAIAMTDSSALVRMYAAEALGQIRDTKSAVALREHVGQSRGDMLETVVLALARLGLPEDIGLFRQRLTDRSPELRRAAAEGLGRAGDRDSIPALETMLKTDRANDARLAAAFALQRLGQTQSHIVASMLALDEVNAEARDDLFELGAAAVPGVLQALKVATGSRYRADLVQTIGYIGGTDDIASIEPLLRDPDERVQRAATQAVARLRR